MKFKPKKEYEASIERTREKRIKWWNEARYGMFVHWGLYSLLGRNEWVHATEAIPMAEYEQLIKKFNPSPTPAREWAKLAKEAGMKYMVLTTKHHEGFCLWDTTMTDFNSMTACGRDLVQEYVDACREFGLKIGFYYSLMDWHHPDGASCAYDPEAAKRFVDFTYGCVQELMSNYGKIDILWYDVPEPFQHHEGWKSLALNQMARKLQPGLLINNRSRLDEDFSTPEGHVQAAEAGRGWEACMTFNDASWGWMPSAAHDAHTPRAILKMLNTACSGSGNLLLNIGPSPKGDVPEDAVAPLTTVGKWLKKNGEAVYGKLDRTQIGLCTECGRFSQKGKKLYFWCRFWPGGEVNLAGFQTKLKSAKLLANSKKIDFEQKGNRIVLKKMPPSSPDKLAGYTIIELEFVNPPVHVGATETPALTVGG
jgi:alpha-L-fucosidase